MRIEVLLFDGFDELDALGPFELLRVAQRAGAGIDVLLVTLDGPRPVTAAHGATLHATAALGEAPEIVVVPGGGWAGGAVHGARAEVDHGVLPMALRARHTAGSTVASVCTGAMIVAAAGLLDGRPATTHRVARDALAESGAELVDARVVDDGDVLSCGGVTSGLDLALHLVERIAGEDLATRVAREVEHERVGQVHRGPRAV